GCGCCCRRKRRRSRARLQTSLRRRQPHWGRAMGEGSKISWCHHTHNPWWGCQRVSPGCGLGKDRGGCYAEAFSKRVGLQLWGAQAPRRFFGDDHWAKPLKWNRAAEKAGERH